jgi:hypothetical protein
LWGRGATLGCPEEVSRERMVARWACEALVCLSEQAFGLMEDGSEDGAGETETGERVL